MKKRLKTPEQVEKERQKKQKVLPWVKDWTDPQDHIRYSNNIKDMKFIDWLYCHPSAYKLHYYGVDSLIVFIFGSVGVYYFVRGSNQVLGFISLIIAVTCLISLIKKYKNRDSIKDLTYYDIHFREDKQ